MIVDIVAIVSIVLIVKAVYEKKHKDNNEE